MNITQFNNAELKVRFTDSKMCLITIAVVCALLNISPDYNQ